MGRFAALLVGVGVFLGAAATATADTSSTLETAINVPKGPGSLEGFGQGYDVSPATGLPGLSYEIGVPSGRGGLVPQLALRYDAGSGSGIVGVGWGFDLPRIERSTRQGIPAYGPDDPLVLRGLGGSEELVDVGGGLLRERIEGSGPVVVRAVGDGYEAVTAAGIRYVFGRDPNARHGGPNGTFRWELEAIEDPFGNRVAFRYERLDGTNRPLLVEATWNDDGAGVRFVYEERPDRVVSRAAGFTDVLAHRLVEVETYVEGEAVQTWTLSYVNTPEAPASRLVAIASRAVDGTALPTWRLAYGAMLAGRDEPQVLSGGPQVDPQEGSFSWVDVDGDGLPDLLSAEAGNWRYRRNLGGIALDDWRQLPQSPSVTVGSSSRFADVDGDGVEDLLHQSTPGGADLWGFLGGGSSPFGVSENVQLATSFDLTAPNVALVDVNLDGRVDVLASEDAQAYVWLRSFEGPGYGAAEELPPLPEGMRLGQPGVRLADADGDRLPDLVRVIPEDGRVLVVPHDGGGRFGEPYELVGAPVMSPSERWEVRDVNGDGAADLVRVGALAVELWTNQLDGSLQMAAGVSWPELDDGERVLFSDVNGNGTVDVLRVDTTGPGGWRYWDLLGVRPGLLVELDNGMGYRLSFEYSSAAWQAYEAEVEGEPWSTFAPQPTPVLSRTEEDDGAGWVRIVEHMFRDGWYDARAGEFRGFGEVRRLVEGDGYRERAELRTVYALGKEDEATKQQVLVEESWGASGLLRRTVNTLAVEQPAPGVSAARVVASDTYHVEGGDEADAVRTRMERTYDGWGRVVEERVLGVVDVETGEDVPGDERVTQRTYADGSRWDAPRDRVAEERVFDGEGTLVGATRRYYDGEPLEGLPLGQVGERGALHRTSTAISATEWVDTERRAYDVYGNVVEVRDAAGAVLERTYDPSGRFPVEERTLLDETSALDALVVRAEWDVRLGVPVRVTDAGGGVTEVAYDGLGRPLSIARPGDDLEQPTWAFVYHLDGSTEHPAVETYALRDAETGAVEVSVDQLDGLGRLRQRVTQDDEGDGAVLAEGRVYDVEGEVAEVVAGRFVDPAALEPGVHLTLDPSWPRTRTYRDAAGRVVEVVDADGYRTQHTYLPLEQVTRDNEDLDGGGAYADTPTVRVQDGLGRLVRVEERLSDRTVVHEYEYDAAGRLTAHTDPEGWTTRYTYGLDGRLLEVDSPDAGVVRQRFDAAGRLVERTDARGAKVTWSYDVLGRVLAEVGFDPEGTEDSRAEFTYDVLPGEEPGHGAGRLVAVEDDAGRLELSYDARGRVVRRTRWFDTRTKGRARMSMAYEYDAQDRVVKEVFPDGSAVSRTYGHRGLEVRVGDFARARSIDGLGRVTEVAYGPGGGEEEVVRQVAQYDEGGRMLSQKVWGRGEVVYHVDHLYDAAGLLSVTTDRLGGTPETPPLDQVFRYDGLRRLVEAQGAYGASTYEHGDDGNLLHKGGLDLVYDGPQPHAATGLGGQRLSYDAAGNLSKVEGEGVLPEGTWRFDSHGRVHRFEVADGRVLEHVYDHEGKRAIRRELSPSGEVSSETLYFENAELRDGKLVKWVRGLGQRIAEVSGDFPEGGFPELPLPGVVLGGIVVCEGSRQRWRRRRGRGRASVRSRWRPWRVLASAVWVLGLILVGSCRCGVEPSYGELRWTKSTRVHVADRLGSAALVLSGEGEVVARAAHLPYGERWVDWQRGSAKPPAYRFTDKEEDRLSGAVYIGARHYLPALGRWASVDPLYLEDPEYATEGPPQANGYLYATANPVMLVDDGGRNPGLVGAMEVLKIAMAKEAQARARHAAAVEKLRRQMRRTGGAKADAIGEMAQAVAKRTEGAREVIRGFQEASVMAASQAAGGAAASGLARMLGAVLKRLAPGIVRSGAGAAKGAAARGAKPPGVSGVPRTGSALKADPHHAFPDVVDNFARDATRFEIPTRGPGGSVVRNSELFQVEGSLNGRSGVFEWIVDQGSMTHRRFIPGGKVTGFPNQVPGR